MSGLDRLKKAGSLLGGDFKQEIETLRRNMQEIVDNTRLMTQQEEELLKVITQMNSTLNAINSKLDKLLKEGAK
ncbi:MAG: hypothetical protein QXM17_08790 [Metallosphaera sp.]